MKYVARFCTFDSTLIEQGDFISLTENGRLVHGWRGMDWVEAASREILEIFENLAAISKVDDGTFFAEVELDSSTGAVTKRWLCRVDRSHKGCGGYGYAKEVK